MQKRMESCQEVNFLLCNRNCIKFKLPSARSEWYTYIHIERSLGRPGILHRAAAANWCCGAAALRSHVAKLSLSPTRTVFKWAAFTSRYRSDCVRAFFGCMCTRYFSRFPSLGCQTAWEQQYEHFWFLLLFVLLPFRSKENTVKTLFFPFLCPSPSNICWGENHTHTNKRDASQTKCLREFSANTQHTIRYSGRFHVE